MVYQYFFGIKVFRAVGAHIIAAVAAVLSGKLFYQRFVAAGTQDFGEIIFNE